MCGLPDRTTSLTDRMLGLPDSNIPHIMADLHAAVPGSLEGLQDQTSSCPHGFQGGCADCLNVSPGRRDYLPYTTEGSQDEIFGFSKRRKLTFSNAHLKDMDICPTRIHELSSISSSSYIYNPNQMLSIYPIEHHNYTCDTVLGTLSLMGHDLIEGRATRLVSPLTHLQP